MPANPDHCLHRRRFDRLHEEPHRRHPAAPRARRRRDRADGHRPEAARRQSRSSPRRSPRRSRSRPRVKTFTDQRAALDGADFVVVAVQIGGYKPGTVTDFEVPKKFGLRQTIADTLGIGGIMRGLRTVPALLEHRARHDAGLPRRASCCNTSTRWRSTPGRSPRNTRRSAQVGLCHSVQGTAEELARDLDVPVEKIRYRCAGINHMAFYLNFERDPATTASTRDLYPRIRQGYAEGRIRALDLEPRCPNKVRYEVIPRTRLFRHRELRAFRRIRALVHQARPPGPDREVRHPARRILRCAAIEKIARWDNQAEGVPRGQDDRGQGQPRIRRRIINAESGPARPRHLRQRPEPRPHRPRCPKAARVEVPCLVDRNGIQPTHVGAPAAAARRR